MKLKQTISILVMFIAAIGAMTMQFSPSVSADCAGVKTSVINCDGEETTNDISKTGLWHLLLLVINILSAGVGILAVGGVVYGSILYAASGGSAEQTKKAKDILLNVIMGIVAYALMYSLLNWLIPGGVFN